jgi:hypothetical protein
MGLEPIPDADRDSTGPQQMWIWAGANIADWALGASASFSHRTKVRAHSLIQPEVQPPVVASRTLMTCQASAHSRTAAEQVPVTSTSNHRKPCLACTPTPSKAAPTAGALFALARELGILGPVDGSRAQPKRGIASSRRVGADLHQAHHLVFCARLRRTYQSTVTGRVIPKGCQCN